MKVLYLGDVVGRSGREAVIARLPELRRQLDLDFVVVNGENAAGGFGLTPAIADDLFAAGTDVIVTGNHVWDNRDILPHFQRERRLLRPDNYPRSAPGRGAAVYDARRGGRVLVVQVMGRVFMDPLDDPFQAVERALSTYPLAGAVQFTLVDIHGEATSEKMAMGHFCDGRASLVAGTHSHVPTADHQILPGGTAYLSDVGMCGDFDSVIGMEKTEPLHRFIRKMSGGGRFTPALGEATVCGVYVESDPKSGLALTVAPLRLGGRLEPVWPVGAMPA